MSTLALGARASTLSWEGAKLAKSCHPSIHQGNWEPRTGQRGQWEETAVTVGQRLCSPAWVSQGMTVAGGIFFRGK